MHYLDVNCSVQCGEWTNYVCWAACAIDAWASCAYEKAWVNEWEFLAWERFYFVFELQDMDDADLTDDFDIYLQIQDCGTTGDCNVALGAEADFENYAYSPIKSNYSFMEGINRWFFDSTLLEDDGSFLTSGHYYRVAVEIEDVSQEYEGEDYNIVLTNKGIDMGAFIHAGDADENFLKIDNSISLTPSKFNCFACLQFDLNKTYSNKLDEPITCFGLYTIGESLPTAFRYQIGNEFSNYNEKDPRFRQYFEINTGWVDLISSDPVLTAETIKQEYSTTPNNTFEYLLGNFVSLGLSDFFDYFGVTGKPAVSLTTADFNRLFVSGFDASLGAQCDMNMLFSGFEAGKKTYWNILRIEDMTVINQQDYSGLADLSDTSQFLKKAAADGIRVNRESAKVELYSGFSKTLEESIEAAIIINAPYSSKTVTQDYYDNDRNIYTTILTTMPERIPLQIKATMFKNNMQDKDTFSIKLTYLAIISDQRDILQQLSDFFEAALEDPTLLISAPIDAILKNSVAFVLFMFVIIFLIYVTVMFSGGGKMIPVPIVIRDRGQATG